MARLILLAMLLACRTPEPAERAREVEQRVLAPCCMRQILADHESELAHGLRAEILSRSEGGEPAAAIEDDLVRRYGDAIRAMPRGSDPRGAIGALLAAALIASAVFIMFRLTRRRRAPMIVPAIGEPAYEDQLDDELDAID